MLYNVTGDFSQINETAGTIQNNSYIYQVEISNQPVPDSGILLYPLNKFSFSGTKLFMRCVDGGGWAEIRVVPFFLDFSGGTSTNSSNEQPADDTDALIQQMWNGEFPLDPADDNDDELINEMFSSGDTLSTGDDSFIEHLNGIFGN